MKTLQLFIQDVKKEGNICLTERHILPNVRFSFKIHWFSACTDLFA
jgi:hypothetical protein